MEPTQGRNEIPLAVFWLRDLPEDEQLRFLNPA
jgi:hypothetical protein